MRVALVKRWLVGRPMPLAQQRHERLGKATALAVFASDPLSSVAYATEEILFVLVLAGSAALSYSLPIGIGIAALILIVISSYRQTIRAYPQGGGAYIVAKDNLGVFPSLIAAAALLIDYVLTVAVSVAAGVAAVTSAVPELFPYRTCLCVVAVVGGAISVTMFLGITYLAYDLGIVPGGNETVVSKIARQLFGTGPLYFEIQVVTMLILLLAANTSFADFPRLSFFLARDRFIPRQFGTQGDRLVFSNGIVILAGLASVLLVVFQGDTHALLPLYAIGVFVSFTLSQAAMVRRWFRVRGDGWTWRAGLNGVGAFVTGIVMLTIAVTKFVHGAWIVVLLIPTLIAAFMTVRRHYEEVAGQLWVA